MLEETEIALEFLGHPFNRWEAEFGVLNITLAPAASIKPDQWQALIWQRPFDGYLGQTEFADVDREQACILTNTWFKIWLKQRYEDASK